MVLVGRTLVIISRCSFWYAKREWRERGSTGSRKPVEARFLVKAPRSSTVVLVLKNYQQTFVDMTNTEHLINVGTTTCEQVRFKLCLSLSYRYAYGIGNAYWRRVSDMPTGYAYRITIPNVYVGCIWVYKLDMKIGYAWPIRITDMHVGYAYQICWIRILDMHTRST